MLEVILFVVGLLLLVKGADFLVDGAGELAHRLNISKLVVGLTIVAFGTSAPELFINVIAAATGESDIAVGNIVGSNISNILLILGIMLVITKIDVGKDVMKNEIPYSFLAAGILILFALVSIPASGSFALSLIEGTILIAFFAYYVARMYRLSKKGRKIHLERLPRGKNGLLIASNILGGIIGLYLGAELVVNGAIRLASVLGVSEYTISVSVVAIGTSLPELVTGVVAAMRRQLDIGVGNIVGSNIFNILWVLGVTALIKTTEVNAYAIVDIVLLLLITNGLFIFAWSKKRGELTRTHGFVFLALYIIYLIFLFVR